MIFLSFASSYLQSELIYNHVPRLLESYNGVFPIINRIHNTYISAPNTFTNFDALLRCLSNDLIVILLESELINSQKENTTKHYFLCTYISNNFKEDVYFNM